jgi:hypothetical protein
VAVGGWDRRGVRLRGKIVRGCRMKMGRIGEQGLDSAAHTTALAAPPRLSRALQFTLSLPIVGFHFLTCRARPFRPYYSQASPLEPTSVSVCFVRVLHSSRTQCLNIDDSTWKVHEGRCTVVRNRCAPALEQESKGESRWATQNSPPRGIIIRWPAV